MFAGIFSCTPSFSPEINKVYLILSYLNVETRTGLQKCGVVYQITCGPTIPTSVRWGDQMNPGKQNERTHSATTPSQQEWGTIVEIMVML